MDKEIKLHGNDDTHVGKTHAKGNIHSNTPT